MPYKRGNIFYVKRSFEPTGKIEKSLGVKSKTAAQKREKALLYLEEHGRHDLLRYFAAGKVGIARIYEAYVKEETEELEKQLRRRENNPCVAEACERALADKKPDVADIGRYEASVDHFITFVNSRADIAYVRFTDTPPPSCSLDEKEEHQQEEPRAQRALIMDLLRTNTLQKFKQWRLDCGAAKQTINNDLTALSVVAEFSRSRGWIEEKPQVKRYSASVRIRHLSAGQLQDYYAALRPRFRTLMLLLVNSGIRLGEAQALRKRNVRREGNEVYLDIEDNKTQKDTRKILLSPHMAQVIRNHISDLEPNEKLFPTPRRTIQKEHNRACAEAGIEDYTIHDHRHTAAVQLAKAGMPIPAIQRRLGHSDIKTTMRYATYHPSYSEVAPYLEAVEEQLDLARLTSPPSPTPGVSG